MRTLVTIFIVSFFACSPVFSALSGSVHLDPENAEPSKSIELRYEAGDVFRHNSAKLYAFVSVFNDVDVYPVAYSFPLEQSGDTYRCDIKGMPANAAYAMIKIGDGHRFDWNKDQMWDLLFYKGSKAVRGAHMRCALSYLGPVVPNLKRGTDFDKAKHELRLEVQNYPDNVQAKIGLASMLMETGEIDKAEYTRRIEELVMSGYDKTKENEVRAVSRALRAIGRPADGDELEQGYIKDHPTGDLAEESLRSLCYQSQNQKDFEERLMRYLKSFSYTVFSDRMYIDLINSYLQQGNGDEAIRLIRAYPVPAGVDANPPAAILNMFAVSLLKNDSLLALARQYAERAIRSAEHPANSVRPKFMAEEEFRYANQEVEGISHDTYGFILRQLNQPADAAVEFQKAVDLLGDAATAENLEHLSEALVASGKQAESIAVMRTAIRTARALPQTTQRFVSIASPDQDKNRQELKALQAEAHDAKLTILRQSKMNYDIQKVTFTSNDGKKVHINDFQLTDLDGKTITLADLKGKVVVMDFWATWCGPCRMSMPYMQKVYEKYIDNSQVKIVLVNVWERTADTSNAQKLQTRTKLVKTFLTQNSSYTFPMMLDVTDAVVSCFGVTGIPTKFYIDKQGIVQFKEVGFPGADVFVDEASDRIDALLND